MQKQIRRGPIKHSIEQIGYHLPLGLMLSEPGLIHVRALLFISANQALIGHDLEHLENRRVAGRLGLIKRLLNFPDGAGSALPQHSQYLKLGIGRPGRPLLGHRVPPRFS